MREFWLFIVWLFCFVHCMQRPQYANVCRRWRRLVSVCENFKTIHELSIVNWPITTMVRFQRRELTDYLQKDHEVIWQFVDNQHSAYQVDNTISLGKPMKSISWRRNKKILFLALSTFDIYGWALQRRIMSWVMPICGLLMAKFRSKFNEFSLC